MKMASMQLKKTKSMTILLLIATLVNSQGIDANGEESKWFYGLDVMSPGITIRRIDDRVAFLLDVGFDIGGYFYSAERSSTGRERQGGSAGLEEMNLLFRYKAIKFGETLSLHANFGTTLNSFYYTGAGISFMKELGDKNFAYIDADVAFFGAGSRFGYYRWAYATNDRIFGGFARRF